MATFEEVKNIRDEPEKLLIDVRNQSEIQETGSIPGSINIPLPELESALKLSANEFKDKYDLEKPEGSKTLIFSCRSGARAQKAADLAKSLGFENSKSYKGSWTEWAEKHGL
ncbi:rhodanese domain-containing protein CG4456 [Condylostylus longicornis]|uniref:rhodanese domain-containing protein CG4456 n=1 Tax=Condylostylus longicornis TaxID=2530218 RepID=UPI00244E2542|nr:rhodanese domain-containing protein CG4456 [Condylostylus longicornis]